jgi:Fur family transcriptional regulator, peroxide stress response regulator
MDAARTPISERVRRFEELCRRQGMPVTVQRRVILEAVLASDDHPTADEIYERIRDRIPRVSKATVYRVLDTLVGLGLIGRAHHPGSAARFDAKTHRHHHLVCTACRRMVDYETPELSDLPLPAPPSGFQVTDYSIQFMGLCPDCRGAPGREDAPCV